MSAGRFRMSIHKMIRNFSGKSVADVLKSRSDCFNSAVGFRCGAKKDDCIRKRKLCFRKTKLKSCIHTGFDYRNRHGISKTHILTGNCKKSAAGRNYISGVDKSCKIMERGVFVGTAYGFMEGGKDLKMVVPFLIITVCASLSSSMSIFERKDSFAMLIKP